MNYVEFRAVREALRKEQPQLLDLAETNPVRSLAPYLPRVEIPQDAPRAHRCHLAEEWLDLFDLPAGWKNRLFISRGVRHSLSLLLPVLARGGARLHLPCDVYPVYETLASAAGIERESFATLPAPQFPRAISKQAEVLLLPNPLKPLGRYLSGEEVEALKIWLKADERRRLILDAVYTFDTRLHPTTLDLFSGGQTIVLHSLSKGWAAPLVLGAALFPESDVEAFKLSFRDDPPDQSELQRSRIFLREHSRLPHRLREVLEGKGNAAKREMAARGIALDFSVCPGYLTTVALPWEELRERYGVLAIPASTFGSSQSDLSILSSLAVEADTMR